jgi:ornithine cyclodeaminase/alanine dehydrogenase-like protein (mu-crystallin family)
VNRNAQLKAARLWLHDHVCACGGADCTVRDVHARRMHDDARVVVDALRAGDEPKARAWMGVTLYAHPHADMERAVAAITENRLDPITRYRIDSGWEDLRRDLGAAPDCPDCGEPHPWAHDERIEDEQPY